MLDHEVMRRSEARRVAALALMAALIYQHASREVDRSIADHIDAQMIAADSEDEDEEGESEKTDQWPKCGP